MAEINSPLPCEADEHSESILTPGVCVWCRKPMPPPSTRALTPLEAWAGADARSSARAQRTAAALDELGATGSVIGWRITRDAAACGVEVMYADGQIALFRAPSFSEAIFLLGQAMVAAAMAGAPRA